MSSAAAHRRYRPQRRSRLVLVTRLSDLLALPLVTSTGLRGGSIRLTSASRRRPEWQLEVQAFRLLRFVGEEPGQLCTRADSQLRIDAGQVCFDGLDGDEQRCGDLLVGVTLGDEAGDALLGGGEHVTYRCSSGDSP